MIATWMLYCTAVSLLFGLAALALEHGLRVRDWPVRWAWVVSLAASLILPVAVWLAPRGEGAPSASLASAQSASPAIEPLPIRSSFAITDARFPAVEQLDNPLLALWAFGSLGVLAGLLILLVRMHQRRAKWRTELVAGTPVLVSRCTGPAVVGFLRPRIVLPEWVLARDQETRRVVVEHEGEHIRAGDPYLLFVAIAAVVAMPWNLALWWQIRRLRLAIEVDCDARVLRSQVDVRRYGMLLLEVGQLAAGGHPALAAFSEPLSFLERRIRVMTRSRPRTPWPYALGFAAVGTLLMGAAWKTPQPASLGPLAGGGDPVSDTMAPSKDDPVTLTIAPHGQYALSGQSVPVDQLEQRLQAIYTSRSGERVLHVEAREGVVGYDVVVATNAARQAGVRRISGIAAVAENDTPGAPVVERRWEQTLSPLDTLGMTTRPDTAIASTGRGAPIFNSQGRATPWHFRSGYNASEHHGKVAKRASGSAAARIPASAS
jgi:beta-lactamase regulating signal transducer with metallopeptidase domain